MVNEEIVDRFKNEGDTIWANCLDVVSCILIDADDEDHRIDKDDVRDVRENFKMIKRDEIILFIRDLTFWNSRGQGCVITDRALHFMLEKNKPEKAFSLPWADIKSIKIDNKKFCITMLDSSIHNIETNLLLKKKEPSDKMLKRIANFLNEVAALEKPQTSVAGDTLMDENENNSDISNENLSSENISSENISKENLSNENIFNQQIIDRFKKDGQIVWSGVLDDDCRIPKKYRSSIEKTIAEKYREHFSEIEDDEVFLFVRDTSFWNDKSQGCVITNKKIHIILDDNSFSIEWEMIDSIKIHKGQFCLYYDFEEEPITLEPKLFLKKHSTEYSFQKRIADFLDEIANLAVHPARVALEKIDDDNVPEEEKIELAKEMIGQYSEFDCAFEYFLGLDAFKKGNDEEALRFMNSALAHDNLSDFARSVANLVIGEIGLKDEFNYKSDIKKNILNALRIEDSKSTNFDEHTTVFDQAIDALKRYDELFLANIDSIPSHHKKILVPIKSYETIRKNLDLPQSVILLDALHGSDISFPFGHPTSGHVYVAHPVAPKRYIPLDNNELDITEDKIREFCYLAQCMGATKISITSSYSSATDSTTSNLSSVGTNVSTVINNSGTNANNNNASFNRIGEWLRHLTQFNQEYTPIAKPYIPDDLVWFEHEPSWKRLAKQRMNGSLVKHQEHLDVKKSRIIQDSEINELLGSFKYLFVEVEGYLKKYKKSTEKISERIILDIEISFWPIDANGELVSLDVIENSRPINQLMSNYTNPLYMANLNAPENIEDLLEILHFLQTQKGLKKHYKRIYDQGMLIFENDPIALNKIQLFKPKNFLGF
ncbi:MAG: hypothetical protein HDS55_05740 [Barnesiella sp.]|nr:hypothetical protein [Barnesiella sp.]